MTEGYQTHSLHSARGAVILALQKLTAQDVRDAVARIYSAEATIIGISDDAVFITEKQHWHPDDPGAFEGICFMPWIQIHELRGTVPAGTTGDFLAGKGRKQ